MNLPKYELSAESSLNIFEFVSIGTKGEIKKIIKFSETHLKDFYNLGFGDKNIKTGDVDDKVVSNNGDSQKVLAPVVAAIYAFTDRNPSAWRKPPLLGPPPIKSRLLGESQSKAACLAKADQKPPAWRKPRLSPGSCTSLAHAVCLRSS